MNIFAISDDYSQCARALDDLRLNKMIVETSQLLSTAIRLHIGEDGWFDTWNGEIIPYKYCLPWEYDEGPYYKQLIDLVTYPDHPCNVWLREDHKHFMWLAHYFLDLIHERFERKGGIHACESRVPWIAEYIMCYVPKGLPPPSYFPNCTPYKDWEDAHKAYKQVLRDKWNNDLRAPKWTRRGPPEWR